MFFNLSAIHLHLIEDGAFLRRRVKAPWLGVQDAPASIYGDMEVLRITYKLTKGLVEKLLRKGKITYEVRENGIPPFEEYLAFLSEEEARYFLDFPRRWKEGLVPRIILQVAVMSAE